jgi:hypothetical protein
MRGITSTISVAAFHADWMTHMPMRALCERWTISRDQVIRLAVVWELPRRHDRKLRAKPLRQRDPTTTEIQQACIRIQATWSKDVEEEHRVVKSQAFSMKRIPLDSATRSQIDVEYNGDCDVWEERP